MRILYVLILLLQLTSAAYSQTVVLLDDNLRDKLIVSYPQVMTGNALDIPKAAALTGTLDLRSANISNADGIQYFTNINTLDLSNNNLETMPDISSITGLLNFYASNNQLTSLPSMADLQLVDFQVTNNKLSSLPDLSGSTGLLLLYCTKNLITEFPNLAQFPLLSRLVIGENPFASNTIDVSLGTNLTQLHVHKTGIETIIGLEKLTKLTKIYAWGNNISNFSGLDLITTLNTCIIYDNPISELPNFKNKPLSILELAGCLLTFEDIQPLLLPTPPATFNYSPQRPVPFNNVSARSENAFTLSYPISSPLSSNRYVWIKDGQIIDSSASSTLTFNPLKDSDAGTYVLKIYNTSISSLVLATNPFEISVLPCIEMTIPQLDIVSKDCSTGYTIDFSQNQIYGGTTPFRYELTTSSTRKNTTSPLIENIEAGNYFLTIIDSKNCKATDNFTLNRIDNCDPVLTPNGDGITDTYFIEKTGKVSVYDLNRILVNTIQAPAVWDGTDRNGTLLDAGFYILIMEGEKPIYLTIIR